MNNSFARSMLAAAKPGDATRPAAAVRHRDWHVRLLGPGAAVLNSTALRPGDQLLGYLPERERHVGYPIDELCYEQ